MNEREWLDCADPERLLDHLQGCVSERKLRLFAAACCRRIWEQIGKEGRKAVDAAESYAEGRSTLEDLQEANQQVVTGCQRRSGKWWSLPDVRLGFARRAAAWTTVDGLRGVQQSARYAAGARTLVEIERSAAGHAVFVAGVDEAGVQLSWRPRARGKEAKGHERARHARGAERGEDAWWSERREQANLLRCLLGNPFRPATLDPRWLTPAVASIAETCHLERCFADLPVLADALEEGGCTDATILDHCRESGPHARGCWLVDLIRLEGAAGVLPAALVE
jgi:hypothetical protein